jgi:hypothetical protein
MYKLDKNVISKISLFLDVKSLSNFCLSCNKYYINIWCNDYLWEIRLQKEYFFDPEINLFSFEIRQNMKQEKLTYAKIYKSIFLKKCVWYNTICNDTCEPKIIFDKVNKIGTHITSSFRLKEDSYLGFSIEGEYPKGTKIWLADTEYPEAFINKADAVKKIISVITEQFEKFYLDKEARENFIKHFNLTPEEYFKCNLEDLPHVYSKVLQEKHILFAPSPDYPEFPDYYQIKQITI